MKASTMSFRVAVLLAIAGMVWGIMMAIAKDHAAMPAHAHLNLLGFVALFMFGVFYRLNPALERSPTAIIQVSAWIAGVVGMAFGLGLLTAGHELGEVGAAISSIVLLASILVFGWLVFRRDRIDQASQGALARSPSGNGR